MVLFIACEMHISHYRINRTVICKFDFHSSLWKTDPFGGIFYAFYLIKLSEIALYSTMENDKRFIAKYSVVNRLEKNDIPFQCSLI